MGIPAANITEQNRVLDGFFRSDMAADEHTVRLWLTNPEDDDPIEADFGGYTPATIAKADWLAASGGVIAVDGLVSFGTPSSDASDSIRFWSLNDATTDALVYPQPVLTPRLVTAGSAAVRIALSVPYGFNN